MIAIRILDYCMITKWNLNLGLLHNHDRDLGLLHGYDINTGLLYCHAEELGLLHEHDLELSAANTNFMKQLLK